MTRRTEPRIPTCDSSAQVKQQRTRVQHTVLSLGPSTSPSCRKPTSANGKRSQSIFYTILTRSQPSQNNDSLAALSSKVSALRSVTIDIYDNARDQGVIDSTTDTFSNMTTSIKGSARRLGVMASQGNKVAVLKLAGIIIAVVLVLYWLMSWIL